MIFRPTITTNTYQTKNNFFIDIVTKPLESYYEAWIYNDKYGIKELMFAVPAKQQSYEQFLEIVENNIDDSISVYVYDHFNYDDRKEFYAKNNILES